ncbi:Dcp1-like decapping [Penicillium chermesinum]|uniref:Dcp1-like decapping n=1 Tax=Penicillium chermesinum TaxID=63820 RepID=A0A9W9THV1_9EURO|nr:Dcp1-like decapping [Penicillium chermesinum]KAJ5223442.1 Dcp1-like decapping [Penicillium chermesinum]
MASKKARRNNNHSNNHNHTDYESDTAYISDMPTQPAPKLRSNEELNLSVLRRHNPSITNVLSLANYAVIYIFSPSTRSWEKTGIEGSLFVCALEPGSLGEERYSAFVLNRRGLENFDLQLLDRENVELTEEYVILKDDDSANQGSTPANPGSTRIYGIWIYSEPPPNSTAEMRTINANLILECATRAGESAKLAKQHAEAMGQSSLHSAATAADTQAPPEEVQSSVPMGRTISLKDLFGQQRAQDDGFTVHAHNEPPQQPPPPPQPHIQPQVQHQQGSDVLGDLFRRAGLFPGQQQ